MFVDLPYQPMIEDFNKDGELRIESILKLFENAGNAHSDKAGDSIINRKNDGQAWVLTDWLVKIDTFPKYGDKIFARTWCEPVTQIFGTARDFELYVNDKVVGIGTTRWISLNLATGRPEKIDTKLIDMYSTEDKFTFTGAKLPRLAIPQTFDSETQIPLRRCDIDIYNHVHNLTYLDYAMEALPEQIYANHNFKNVRISYKSAVVQGEEIVCKYAAIENSNMICIYSKDGTLKTQIEMN